MQTRKYPTYEVVYTNYKVEYPSRHIMKHDRNFFRFYSFLEIGGIVKFSINSGGTTIRDFQFKVRSSEVIVDINDYIEFPTEAESRIPLTITFYYNDVAYSSKLSIYSILGKTFEYSDISFRTNKIVPIYDDKIHIFSRFAGYLITSRSRVALPAGYSTFSILTYRELLTDPFFYAISEDYPYNPDNYVDYIFEIRYSIRNVCRHKKDSLMLSFIDRYGILRYEECFFTNSKADTTGVFYPVRDDYAVKDIPTRILSKFEKTIELTFPNITKDIRLEDILLGEGVELHLFNGDTSKMKLVPVDGSISASNEPQDITLTFKILE